MFLSNASAGNPVSNIQNEENKFSANLKTNIGYDEQKIQIHMSGYTEIFQKNKFWPDASKPVSYIQNVKLSNRPKLKQI